MRNLHLAISRVHHTYTILPSFIFPAIVFFRTARFFRKAKISRKVDSAKLSKERENLVDTLA